MTSFTLSIQGQTPITGELQLETSLPPRPLWYVPHDLMRRDVTVDDFRYVAGLIGRVRQNVIEEKKPLPEVYRMDPEHSIALNEDFRDLLCAINPDISREKALGLLAMGLAWCNANEYVFDQPRVCGGATLEESYRDGNKVYIKSILTSQPVPTAEQVMASHCWYWATSVKPDGSINVITRLGPDGYYHWVRMFIVTDEPVYINADELLPVTTIPDPRWMG